MHHKNLLLAACVFAAFNTAVAQSSDATVDEKPQRDARIEFGVRASGFISLERDESFYQFNNLHGVAGGAAARLRSGSHHRFGLELAANHGVSERSFTQVEDWQGLLPSEIAGFRKHTTDVGVQFQLHPGRDGQAVRPYVGAGLGAAWNRYSTENLTLDGYLNNRFGPAVEPMLQLEQGLMWEIVEGWYFSQSLYYRYEMDYGASNVGIRLGFFYGL